MKKITFEGVDYYYGYFSFPNVTRFFSTDQKPWQVFLCWNEPVFEVEGNIEWEHFSKDEINSSICQAFKRAKRLKDRKAEIQRGEII